MSFIKYDCVWVGIDGGREGLWKEPIWTQALSIIAEHQDEPVYDQASPIYEALEKAYPNEAWRSRTSDGHFRPLFRDYPNSWTRTGVITLIGQRFNTTPLGREVLAGRVSKSELLVNMFRQHIEQSGPDGENEKPFAILAAGLLAANRPLATEEIYWAVMKNFRPGQDDLAYVLRKKLPLIHQQPDTTPYRRLRNMLTLMRASGAVSSTRRGPKTFWPPFNTTQLNEIAKDVTQ